MAAQIDSPDLVFGGVAASLTLKTHILAGELRPASGRVQTTHESRIYSRHLCLAVYPVVRCPER